MSEIPEDEGPDALTGRYRRVSAADPSRASAAVRETILAHARALAERTRRDSRTTPRSAERRGMPGRSWPIWGAAAAAAITALIAVPLYREADVIAPPAATEPAAPSAAIAPATQETEAPMQRAPARTAPRSDRLQMSPQPVAPNVTAAAPPSRAAGAARAHASDAAIAESAAKSSAAPAANAAPAPLAVPHRLAGAPAREARGEPLAAPANAADAAERQPPVAAASALETRDGEGRTPLFLAVLRADRQLVRALLAQGADPNAADSQGRTPLAVARARHDTELVRVLEAAGAR